MESIALKIVNNNGLRKLEKEIDQLKDSTERDVRERLLDAIWDKIYEYDAHILDYEYKQHIIELSKRGLEFVPVEKNPVVANWDEVFTSAVSEETKKHAKHYNDQYKWHLFSFDLLDALKLDAAREIFDTIEKDAVYLFFQYAEECYFVKNASLLKAKDLDFDSDMSKADIYVFDPVGKWTYVKTHEDSCGPYFYSIN
ncbi:DUF4275 family protein [Anaerotignum propionicum]|uniref:DUF4275 family protein n=1 Tax=Anaerotignum propionicum DSM 1682 TaxID=991789 RepID=A0ABM5YCJ0_ANAPI|nr:DUF4275 family protein [Anaerotignum propionicum]AMJ41568.1 hypothetical protein CPRO_19860 [Anaerotignum propionicum DSM 1682]